MKTLNTFINEALIKKDTKISFEPDFLILLIRASDYQNLVKDALACKDTKQLYYHIENTNTVRVFVMHKQDAINLFKKCNEPSSCLFTSVDKNITMEEFIKKHKPTKYKFMVIPAKALELYNQNK